MLIVNENAEIIEAKINIEPNCNYLKLFQLLKNSHKLLRPKPMLNHARGSVRCCERSHLLFYI